MIGKEILEVFSEEVSKEIPRWLLKRTLTLAEWIKNQIKKSELVYKWNSKYLVFQRKCWMDC